MKKLILSIALMCFCGATKIYAQSDASATKPATSVAAVVADPTVSKATTVSGGQSVETPATVKTEAKAEAKKSSCTHSKKSCCMSKDGASKKECKDMHSEKAEIKSEKSDTKVN